MISRYGRLYGASLATADLTIRHATKNPIAANAQNPAKSQPGSGNRDIGWTSVNPTKSTAKQASSAEPNKYGFADTPRRLVLRPTSPSRAARLFEHASEHATDKVVT